MIPESKQKYSVCHCNCQLSEALSEAAEIFINVITAFFFFSFFVCLRVRPVPLCSLTLPELSNMSFEDIMKLQSKVGTKVYNEVAYGGEGSSKSGERRKKKRLNKNR